MSGTKTYTENEATLLDLRVCKAKTKNSSV